jgi:hypothetical protein
MAFILSVLGVVLVIEGLPYFAFPAKIREWGQSLVDISDKNLRIMGFASMIIGLIMLFIVKSFLSS